MVRKYKCLTQGEFSAGDYQLVCIRDADKYAIRKWRNEQIDILRQSEPLTSEQQESYFLNVVDKLFQVERPNQLLFSFLEQGELVGYGGLVHIDWVSTNGEISFITDTPRNSSKTQFKSDWTNYLNLLKLLVQTQLGFAKIYTYAYDVRPPLFEVLSENGFDEEARLKNHISIKGKLHDVLIHSYFFKDIQLRVASQSDAKMYFDWANDPEVRRNSFRQDPIEWDTHVKWFNSKLVDPKSVLYVATLNGLPVGQIRFDQAAQGEFEIDFSIDAKFRGRGLGQVIIAEGSAALLRNKMASEITGKVKTENKASARSFERAGFTRSTSSNRDSVLVYRKGHSMQP